jgi:hypothetical protein
MTAIYCTSASVSVIDRQLQLVLNRLYKWSYQNGFTFSRSKTYCIHFCRKHQLHADPVLYLGNIPVPFVESAKFLGLHFDRSLAWRNHVIQLRVEKYKGTEYSLYLKWMTLGSRQSLSSLPVPCSCWVCFGLW